MSNTRNNQDTTRDNKAQLHNDQPHIDWAALRLWATGVRDNEQQSSSVRSDARTLISILDSQENLRTRHKQLASSLWKSALQLAEKITQSTPHR